MEAQLLRSYWNGGTHVSLFDDGTKERRESTDEPPTVPESIDLKVTDFCMEACAWCHESSTPRGIHGGADWIVSIMRQCPNTEFAIGGGNPLSHPRLRTILAASDLCNLTVNERSLKCPEASGMLTELVEDGAIRGLGVSLEPKRPRYDPAPFSSYEHTVFHLIAGVHAPFMAFGLRKVLVLGYKHYGFGTKHYSREVEARINAWRVALPTIINDCEVVSFDNLALEQLRVRSLVGEALWEKHYMGDDGTLTFYIDGAKRQFAATSTSKRRDCEGMTVGSMFRAVRKENHK